MRVIESLSGILSMNLKDIKKKNPAHVFDLKKKKNNICIFLTKEISDTVFQG